MEATNKAKKIEEMSKEKLVAEEGWGGFQDQIEVQDPGHVL